MPTPRLALINPLRGPCPPDGYRYVDPFDGWVCHAWDYRTWVEQEEKHLSANDREIPLDLGESMQEQLCKTLPPGWCMHDDPNRPRVNSVGLTWQDLARGVETFARWMASGMRYVEKKEAERRALICTRCYFNTHIDGCAGCQKLVAEVTTGKETKYDFSLFGCGVCKCVLKAKVHFPLEILDKENSSLQELYPEHCWLKKGGPNYHGSSEPLPD